MTQTSFDANLVMAKRSAVGVERALALFDCDKFFMRLVFQFFLHMSKAAYFVQTMILAIE